MSDNTDEYAPNKESSINWNSTAEITPKKHSELKYTTTLGSGSIEDSKQIMHNVDSTTDCKVI